MNQLSTADVNRAVDAGIELLNHGDVMVPVRLKRKLTILEELLGGLAQGALTIQTAPPPEEQYPSPGAGEPGAK